MVPNSPDEEKLRMDISIEEVSAVGRADRDMIYGDHGQNIADIAALEAAIDALNRQALLRRYSNEVSSSLSHVSALARSVISRIETELSDD